jgi:hypothetical protein
MKSQTRSRLVFCALMTGLMSMQSASGAAGRSVRSDSSDSAFDFQGGFWGTDNQQFGPPGFDAGPTDFKLRLNPAETAHFFRVCMSEDGFLKLIGMSATCANTDYALPQTKAYIAVFATDLDSLSTGFGSLIRTRGFVDSKASQTSTPPYKLWQTDPATRFWWNGVTLAGDSSNGFDVQIVLIDRSNGTNNGDFDIEFNYGNGFDQVPPLGTESNPNANGFRGFKLGPNSRGPTFGPFGPFDANGTPIRFCFRGGSLQTTCN